MEQLGFEAIFPSPLYFQKRWEWLRKPLGMPEGSEKVAEDEEAFHFAALLSYELVSICMLQKENQAHLYRLRFMATDPAHCGKGIGKGLVNYVEQFIFEKDQQASIILDAREVAVPFYQKCGYSLLTSEPFLKVGIPHFAMKKKVDG